MSFGITPGLVSSGPGASGNRPLITASYSVPPGYLIRNGQVFKRNLCAVTGSNYRYPQYSGPDFACLPTDPRGGPVLGVYVGQDYLNTTPVAQTIGLKLRREGICKTLVGANGNRIQIGFGVGYTGLIGASTSDIPMPMGYAYGLFVGWATAQNINTRLTAPVASGAQTVTVANTHSLTTTSALVIDYGTPFEETVVPSVVTNQVKASGNVVLGGTFVAGATLTLSINGVTASYTTVAGDTNLAGAAASFSTAINASLLVHGAGSVIAPTQTSGSTIYLFALTTDPVNNSNTIIATGGGTITATASGLYFTGGTYGSITAMFQYAHAANSVVIGQQTTMNAILMPPVPNSGIDVDSLLLDLQISATG